MTGRGARRMLALTAGLLLAGAACLPFPDDVCGRDADCAEGQWCDPAEGRCMPLGHGGNGNGGNGNGGNGEPGGDGPWPGAMPTAGFGHACLVSEGRLYCWGRNDFGQVHAPPGPPVLHPSRIGEADDWITVSAGWTHTCGIRASSPGADDGLLICWGDNGSGQVDPADTDGSVPPTEVPGTWRAVAGGGYHTCAIDAGGDVSCWGNDQSGQVQGGGGIRAAGEPVAGRVGLAVTAGQGHSCAIVDEGALYCWGENGFGQTGQGGTGGSAGPAEVVGSLAWDEVSAGTVHTCGRSGDAVYCWGFAEEGRLGLGDTSPHDVPALVGEGFRQVTAGADHTCAIGVDGEARCWGDNLLGAVGVDDARQVNGPRTVIPEADGSPVSSPGWHALAGGLGFTCGGTRDGSLWCWGRNLDGELGIGAGGTVSFVPVPIHIEDVATLAGGGDYACALIDGGERWCWGRNAYGELGRGDFASRSMPDRSLDPPGGGQWEQISLGRTHGCGIDGSRRLHCWGEAAQGRLGSVGSTDATAPRQIAEADGRVNGWVHVAAGGAHACAVHDDGTLWCWGDGAQGQIGGPASSSTPVRVGTGDQWLRVYAGELHNCAIDKDDALWCWGRNGLRQVADDDESSHSTPVQVAHPSGGPWADATLGVNFTCARDESEGLWCWGGNHHGSTGLGTEESPVSIGQVVPGSAWRSVCAGGLHVCGVHASGTLWCWGRNAQGQAGQAPGDDLREPTIVSTDEDWDHVACGHEFACATRTSGEAFCWGNNRSGQLGDGSAFRLRPVQVTAPAGD